MTQKRVTSHIEFSAAHSIPDGPGKHVKKHGHNWQATVTVDLVNGKLNDGFITDIDEIDKVTLRYDHEDLNDFFKVPSSENVAAAIAEDALEICKKHNPDRTFIVNVHLSETPHHSADASATNFVTQLTPPAGIGVDFVELEKRAKDAEAAYGAGTNPTAKFIKRVKS